MLHKVTDEHGLTPRQERFLQSLLAGDSIVTAAARAHITNKTAHQWLKQEAFKEAFNTASDELFEDAMNSLKMGMGEAIAGLHKHLIADVEPTPATQMVAIRVWIEQAITNHKMRELQEEIAELKKLLTQPRPTDWRVIS